MEKPVNENSQIKSKETYRRWYDKDPVLSKAMNTLKNTDDNVQIQIALNLIKIVIEHQIEENNVNSVNDLINTVQEASNYDESHKSRWYDLNETLRAAILMLQNCPEDLRKKISVDMAEFISRMIEEND